jgi:hypothetical protein
MRVTVAIAEASQPETLVEGTTDFDGRFEMHISDSEALRSPLEIRLYVPGARDQARLVHQEVVTSSPESLEISVPREHFEQAGLPTELAWSIKWVRFAGGQRVSLSPRSLTLLVGSNGSGKTCALQGMARSTEWTPGRYRSPLVSETQVEPSRPDKTLIRNWIRRSYPIIGDAPSSRAGGQGLLARTAGFAKHCTRYAVTAPPSRSRARSLVGSSPTYEGREDLHPTGPS